MKKVVALILLTAILASLPASVSCGERKAGDETDTPASDQSASSEETSSKYADELPELDYEGAEFRILTFDQSTLSFARSVIDVLEQSADTLNDAIYQRNRAVEERLNIKIVEGTQKYAPSDNLRDTRNFIMSNDDTYSVVMDFATNITSLAMEGLLVDFRDLKYVDLSREYWSDSLNSSLSIANKNYLAAGDFSFSTHDGTGAIIFNKTLHDSLKLDDVYELVRTGKWTFDAFGEQARAGVQDLDGNGTMDVNDRYGYLSIPKEIPSSFWIGAGTLSVSKDQDDIPYLSADHDERFINAFDKLLDIIWSDNVWFSAKTPNGANESPKFENGQGLFAFQRLYSLDQMRDKEVDFGIIPFPKYDEAQDYYYSRVAGLVIGMVPKSASDLDMTGAVLEALCSASRTTTIKAYYDIMLESKLTRDEESSEMLDIIFAHRVCDHGDLTWVAMLRDGIFCSMVMNNDHAIASKTSSVKARLDKSIAETVDGLTQQ